MSELKERKEMDPAYEWDLSTLYANDEAFEKALKEVDAQMEGAASYAGRLKDSAAVLAYLKANTALSLEMNNLFTYASLRRTEDTRDANGQSMYGRAYAKYVQASAATAFAEPEILSLEEGTLQQIIADPLLQEYHFYLEDLLRSKAHTLSAKEESLLAQFGEVLANPGQVSDTLMDADMAMKEAIRTVSRIRLPYWISILAENRVFPVLVSSNCGING